MSSPRKTPRTASLAAVAAFGVASLGSISLAAAHPETAPHSPEHYSDHRSTDYNRSPDYDLDDDGILEHVEIDYRHYDRDRSGVLDRSERTAYWNHMLDMGTYGNNLTPVERARLSRIAFLFDRDRDGRLTGDERVAITRLIRASRLFSSLDRNGDGRVSVREARIGSYRTGDRYMDAVPRYNGNFFSWTRIVTPGRFQSNNWIAIRFDTLDRNDDTLVTWPEIERYLVRAFRS